MYQIRKTPYQITLLDNLSYKNNSYFRVYITLYEDLKERMQKGSGNSYGATKLMSPKFYIRW